MTPDMTDHIDHYAAAERMWAAPADEPMPEEGKRACLAYAQVRSLLDGEIKRREEDDHE